MSPASCAYKLAGNKKHQGKISLVCVYVSLLAAAAVCSDEARDDDTASIDN